MIFGHELWRSVCPLSFLSQIPRKLGIQRKYVIQKNTWLGQNHYYLQFALLFIGLTLRLLLINSDRLLLGIFLLSTIVCAIIIGFLWDGKTFCNYFCPFACVEEIFSEPGGVFELKTDTKKLVHLSQSGCRKRKKNGRQMSNCIGCKSACIDINSETSYWSKINQPDRKLIYYSYLGLVTGFYLYFWLCSGNWNFITEGIWNETNQLNSLLSPGLYILDHLIFIPKLIAVPLTLLIFSWITYQLGIRLEKIYKRYNKLSDKCLTFEQIHHQLFTIFAFVAFNIIFFIGTIPAFNWLPLSLQYFLIFIVIFMSFLWAIKNWKKSLKQYMNKKRKSLQKSYNYLENIKNN